MTDEQWPPNSGVPDKKRFKKAAKLKWGETPFDDLTRAELLRLVQAYHSTVVAAQCVMKLAAGPDVSSFWSFEGSGGRALAKANALMNLAGENDKDPASEKIYRMFFRSADVLLFPHLRESRWGDWGINDKGEMIAPHKGQEGFRPIEWRDILPEKPGHVGQPNEAGK